MKSIRKEDEDSVSERGNQETDVEDWKQQGGEGAHRMIRDRMKYDCDRLATRDTRYEE